MFVKNYEPWTYGLLASNLLIVFMPFNNYWTKYPKIFYQVSAMECL